MVLGRFRVNRKDTLLAQVRADLKLVFWNRPGRGWETLQYIVGKFFSREVAILQKRARLDFNVTNGTELLDESAEGMKRADRLQIRGQSSFCIRDKATHMTLDAGDEQLVRVRL